MRRLVAALLVLLLVAVSSPAFALGPFDGLWQVVETHPTQGQTTSIAFVVQNNNFASSGFNVLFSVQRLGLPWRVGAGTVSGNTLSNAALFDDFINFIGVVNGTFTDPLHFQGTVQYEGGVTSTLTAVRVF